jgi:Pyruvate/2-oxoacid:ferredoxin oxidoreductase delta subunit
MEVATLCPKANEYVLTFRCVNCGRYEASSHFSSESIESEDRIRAKIYQALCKGCGWKGHACGYSAVRIYRANELLQPSNGTSFKPHLKTAQARLLSLQVKLLGINSLPFI